MERPELSILSDDFLEGLSRDLRANLQMELLERLLADRIRTIRRRNVVQARAFSELLDDAIRRHTNRALSTAEIIAELVKLAREMRDAESRGAELGLRDDEHRLEPRGVPPGRPARQGPPAAGPQRLPVRQGGASNPANPRASRAPRRRGSLRASCRGPLHALSPGPGNRAEILLKISSAPWVQ